jgi:RNA polymerase-binding protein DksA
MHTTRDSQEIRSMTLTTDQLDQYRKQLNGERKRILQNIGSLHEELGTSLHDDSDENGLETHIGDLGTITFLRERDLSLEATEEHLLQEIDDALVRVRKGTFGRCVDCNAEIPADRLEALPWAARCMEHQQAHSG